MFIQKKSDAFYISSTIKQKKFSTRYKDNIYFQIIQERKLNKDYIWKEMYVFIISISKNKVEIRDISLKSLWDIIVKIDLEKIQERKKHEISMPNKELRKADICFVDVLVRSNTIACEKNHVIEDIAAGVLLAHRNGKVVKYVVPACYCMSCKVYFIQSLIYEQLKQSGRLLCQVVTREQFANKIGLGDSKYRMYALESPLKIYGYNVNKAEDLSQEQRHRILENIVDSKILSVNRVISYLSHFIEERKNLDEMIDARKKWQEDIDYISKYELGSKRHVNIGSITEVKYFYNI